MISLQVLNYSDLKLRNVGDPPLVFIWFILNKIYIYVDKFNSFTILSNVFLNMNIQDSSKYVLHLK